MKKITLSLIVMLLSITSIVAQIKSFDLKKGEVYEVTTVTDLNIEQEAMGQKMEVGQGISIVESLEVLDISNGLYKMKATTMQVKIDIEAPMQPAQTMDSEGTGQMNDVAKAFVNKSYTFYMDKFGQVEKFEGLEEMSMTIIADLDKTVIGQAGQSQTMAQLLSEDMIKTNLSNMFAIYPTDGSKEWEYTSEVVFNALPAKITAKRYYDGDATIMSAGNLSVKGTQQQMGMTIEAEMAGTVNTIYDLMQNGMPSKVQVQQDATGKASAQGMDIPMDLKMSTIITITKQ